MFQWILKAGFFWSLFFIQEIQICNLKYYRNFMSPQIKDLYLFLQNHFSFERRHFFNYHIYNSSKIFQDCQLSIHYDKKQQTQALQTTSNHHLMTHPAGNSYITKVINLWIFNSLYSYRRLPNLCV